MGNWNPSNSYGQMGGFNIMGLDPNAFKQFNSQGGNSIDWDARGRDLSRLLATGLFPLLLQQMQSSYSMEPDRQASLQRAVSASSPGNRQAMVDRIRAQLLAQAGAQGNQNAMAARGSGAGQGYAQGAQLDATNRANETANNMSADMATPQAEMQNSQQLMQLLGLGQSMPALGQFGQLASLSGGQAPGEGQGFNFGNALMSILPGLAGSLKF